MAIVCSTFAGLYFVVVRIKHTLLIMICSVSLLYGQGTIADYKRAEETKTLYQNKVFHNPTSFNWIDGKRFWYLDVDPVGKSFIETNVETKTKYKLFDHKKLAKSLSGLFKKRIDPLNLPFNLLEVKQNIIRFTIDSALCSCELKRYACIVEKVEIQSVKKEPYWGNFFDEASNESVKSPDGNWLAFIRDFNLFMKDIKTQSEYQLSYDGSVENAYSTYIYWSDDSKKIVAYKVTTGAKRRISFVESSPVDQLQPKLHHRDYAKPGDDLPQRSPQLFLVDTKEHVPVKSDLFLNQYYLENIQWRKDSKSFTFEFNARGHQQYKIIEVDATSGNVREVITETSKTFIDYSGKKIRYDVADGSQIIWASERDGWNHLYLYDGNTGNVKNQITKGQWVVRHVEFVDESNQQIIFSASGLDANQDPYLVHYCIINFDGSGFRRLTVSDANHKATFSPDYKYFVDYSSRVDSAPESRVVRVTDGTEVMRVSSADITMLLGTGWKFPEVFTAKGRDGITDIWGVIYRPRNCNPSITYPIIELIYAGPHGFNVPKNFSEGYYTVNSLVELGFIVVIIDGMGTSGRSKAFHDVCWKNLKDAGFEDRIAWMKSAAMKYPYMDIKRVGIFGGSAGGQNAAGALIFQPGFYKAAVASCGSHDNRMDKIWWNEQWMGYPVGPQYAESSNVTQAHKLQGKLLLMVGEVDDNVDPATTMQVANALIKANKDFELVVLPGMNHTGGGLYGDRKRRDFFVRHLLHVTPPDWTDIYR